MGVVWEEFIPISIIKFGYYIKEIILWILNAGGGRYAERAGENTGNVIIIMHMQVLKWR